MSFLEVPGARLYYETRGGGPLMVMVPGAGGSADAFARVAEHLGTHCTVVTYDRRGFSRSQLDGPQDYEHRLATDVDDVRRLIERLSDEPATVFGASSGGVIALEVLTSHPDVVGTLVAFEPAAVTQLPDGREWMEFFFELYDLYRRAGMGPALESFRQRTATESDRLVMARVADPRTSEYGVANASYWFEHELRQYPGVDLDVGALKTHVDRIVLAVGRESPGFPCYQVNVSLAEKLGLDLVTLPGGHVGCVAHPREFAQELVQALDLRPLTAESW